MKNIKQESGRSMVEMLGVLAIIGVLSIGGIAGYTMAMNRYRANEILDAASKLSVVAQTAAVNTGTFTPPTLESIGLTGTKVHEAEFEVVANGDVTLKTLPSNGVQSALKSILGLSSLGTSTPIIDVDTTTTKP